MTWQYIYLFVIFAAVAICLGIAAYAAYAWKRRSTAGVGAFAVMMLAVAEWLFTSGMVSMSHDPAQARFWVNPRFFGLTAMLAFFIIFVIQYTGHGKWLTRPRLAFFISVPLLTQAVIETNALHHLFLVSVDFSPDGILMGIDAVRYGAVFWLHTVYSYLLVLVGMGMIVRMAVRTFHLYRGQALLLILGILPPLLTSVTDAFLLIPGLKHPLAPIGFAIMGIAFSAALFQHRMLDIVPVARDAVIESMVDVMIALDSRGNVVDINPSARQFLGLEASQVIGQPIERVFPPWKDLVEQHHGQPFAQSEVALDVAGKSCYYDLRTSPLRDHRQRVSGQIVILRDITARKRAEDQLVDSLAAVKALQEKLYEQANRDPLTNLYNRRLLTETIQREIRQAARDGYPVSIVIMDIDHFKEVNDTYGHEAGDMVLKNVAAILTRQTREHDYVFRYGGEEFLVLLPATHPCAASQFAERWRAYFQETPLFFANHRIEITMSMGVAAFLPGDGKPEEVLAAADSAMYRAKEEGRNCVVMFKAY